MVIIIVSKNKKINFRFCKKLKINFLSYKKQWIYQDIIMATIKKVLIVDKKHHVIGIDGDLHTIDKLVSDQTLDYDMPTLCGNNIDKPNILLNSTTKIQEKIQ